MTQAPSPVSSDDPVWIVTTTLPDEQQALDLARVLVEEGLAACVQVQSPCTSVYRWEGQTRIDREWPLVAKTRASAFGRLRDRIQGLHPYDLPEIVASPVADGLPDYLDWVRQTVPISAC